MKSHDDQGDKPEDRDDRTDPSRRNDPKRQEEPEYLIFRYTIEQAEEDGILYNISRANPVWERGFISHVTTNLMNQGYMEKDDPSRVRMPNLVDLLNQCNQPLLRDFKKNELDHFYSLPVEFPDGQRREVYVALNEWSRYTIMLPEDW